VELEKDYDAEGERPPREELGDETREELGADAPLEPEDRDPTYGNRREDDPEGGTP
jgi:hypothetical protein